MQTLLDKGGYMSHVAHTTASSHAVNVCIDGYQPSIEDLHDVLKADEKDSRGSPWKLIEQDPIIRLEPESGSEWHYGEGSEAGGFEEEDQDRIGHHAPRWIFRFETAGEARRFVRFWHKRPLVAKLANQAPAIVNAELLW